MKGRFIGLSYEYIWPYNENSNYLFVICTAWFCFLWSFLWTFFAECFLKWNIHSEKYTSDEHTAQWMFIKWTHLWNHHPYDKIPQKLPSCHTLLTPPHPHKIKHYLAFRNYYLIYFQFLNFKYEIMLYICFWLLLSETICWDSSMLRVAIVYLFSLVYAMSLYAHIIINMSTLCW